MLHGVIDDEQNYDWSPLRPYLPYKNFKKSIHLLSKYYSFISLSDAVAMLEGKKPLQPYSAVLTFDDGYINNKKIALSFLDKYKIPATFFVTTGHIEHRKFYWYDLLDYAFQHSGQKKLEILLGEEIHSINANNRKDLQESYRRFLRYYNPSNVNDFEVREEALLLIKEFEKEFGEKLSHILINDEQVSLMSWHDVIEVAQQGVSIGSHTADHVRLATVPTEEIRQQLESSKNDIEKQISKSCEFLCYPNGSFNEEVISIARACGYRAAVTTLYGTNKLGHDLFSLRRIPFPRTNKKISILASASGLFDRVEIFSGWWSNCVVSRIKKIMPISSSGRSIFPVKVSHAHSSTDSSEPNGEMNGQNRFVKNVIFGWGAQFVYVIAGFILPRMINNSMGSEALGVWDFAWSLIAYFGLVQAGVVSSVNRYVAGYRAVHDNENVNVSVSSVNCILMIMAAVIVLLSLGAYILIPKLLITKLGEYVFDARSVVFWLSMSLAVQVGLAGYGGVLTGCHRWDLHHGVNVVSRVATLFGMIVVLFSGGGLVTLALVYFFCESLVLVARIFLAYRTLPELQVRFSLIRWQRSKEMLSFGGKTFLPTLGDLFSVQTVNILIVWFLGPTALAIFARPLALIRHVQTFMARFAFVLSPTASSMQAMDDVGKINELLIKAGRYGALIVFPMMSFLFINGGPLLQVWMGEQYNKQLLISAMVLGYLPAVFQLPMGSIVRGLNIHGRPGIVRFIAAIVGIGGAVFAMGILHLHLEWVVVAVAIPLWASEVIYVPLYVKRHLSLSLRDFWRNAIVEPAIYVLPFTIVILLIRICFRENPYIIILLSFLIGTPVLFIVYWKKALSDLVKNKIKRKISMVFKI